MRLIVAVTGASGAFAAKLLVEKSPWPVWLVASRWGETVYRQECGDFDQLASKAEQCFQNDDLNAPISSGSVSTQGMIILPCSTNTMSKIAQGAAGSLITRAAHCHLKERRRLVLCVRETPWSLIDLQNAERATQSGAVVMPLVTPYYLFSNRDPKTICMEELLSAYVDRVLALFGRPCPSAWKEPP